MPKYKSIIPIVALALYAAVHPCNADEKAEALAIFADTPKSPIDIYLNLTQDMATKHFDVFEPAAEITGAALLRDVMGSNLESEPGIAAALKLQERGVRILLYSELDDIDPPDEYVETIPYGLRFKELSDRGVKPVALVFHWELKPRSKTRPSKEACDALAFAAKSAWPGIPIMWYGHNEYRIGPDGAGFRSDYLFDPPADIQTATLYHEEPPIIDLTFAAMRKANQDAGITRDVFAWYSWGYGKTYQSGNDSQWAFHRAAKRSIPSFHYEGKRFAYWAAQPHGGIKLSGVIMFKGLEEEQSLLEKANALRAMVLGMRREGLR